jgi:DNA end-binding protein Ku
VPERKRRARRGADGKRGRGRSAGTKGAGTEGAGTKGAGTKGAGTKGAGTKGAGTKGAGTKSGGGKRANRRISGRKRAARKGERRAEARTDAQSREGGGAAGPEAPRSFWSGTITFGLVSVPVHLFVANRNTSVSLRMVDEDGVPLSRRYVCGVEGRPLENDEIVRGYEVEKDRFVLVDDDELEALAPDKSREIDLERFVPLDELDPIFFDRAYFLAPDREAARAYRLLAKIMEDSGRAGIATFVMRGKEYLVAIIAESGLLRAETLRFEDELRTPADAGLPEIEAPDDARVGEVEEEIARLEAESFEREALADPRIERLREVVARKLDAGNDVVEAPEDADVEASATVVDLMEVLKQSLAGTERSGAARKGPARAQPRADADDAEALAGWSKQALYERAQALDIEGRSSMTKDELLKAIRGAG